MKNKIKEFKGVVLFYLLIILCIFMISNNNSHLKEQKNPRINMPSVTLKK